MRYMGSAAAVLFCIGFVGALVGFAAGAGIVEDKWKTRLHNASATGSEIIVDGERYSVYRSPEPKALQAQRSEYARRCQAITDRFFEGEYK